VWQDISRARLAPGRPPLSCLPCRSACRQRPPRLPVASAFAHQGGERPLSPRAGGAQGQQMECVLDDLEQIHFSMKKANQVLRDMTRGIATDRRARGAAALVHGTLPYWFMVPYPTGPACMQPSSGGGAVGACRSASAASGAPASQTSITRACCHRSRRGCRSGARPWCLHRSAVPVGLLLSGRLRPQCARLAGRVRPCRCLQFFLMVIILAVVIIIILKAAGVGALRNVFVPLPSFQARAHGYRVRVYLCRWSWSWSGATSK